MEIQTRDFGKANIDEKDIINFVQPLFGFEQYSKYAMLKTTECGECFVWLQSIEKPDLCFILSNISLVKMPYDVIVSDISANKLGISEGDDVAVWLVTVINDDVKKSTVNLKSPIVINPENNLAVQENLEEDYPIRYSIFEN